MWQSFKDALFKDDLVIRVALFVFGCLASAFGVAALNWAFLSPDESGGWLLGIGILGAVFLLWGAIIAVAAFTPPSSPWSRFAEKIYPDPAGLDDAAIFVIIVLLPAILLTLALRAVGIRGYEDQ